MSSWLGLVGDQAVNEEKSGMVMLLMPIDGNQFSLASDQAPPRDEPALM
jgi:hypothetical protein